MNVFGTQMSEAYFLCLSQHSGENKGVDRLVIEHNIYSFLTCNFASQLAVMEYLLPLVPDKIRNLPTHMVCTDICEVCLCEWVGVSNAANTTHAGAWPIGSCHTTSSIWSRIYIKKCVVCIFRNWNTNMLNLYYNNIWYRI